MLWQEIFEEWTIVTGTRKEMILRIREHWKNVAEKLFQKMEKEIVKFLNEKFRFAEKAEEIFVAQKNRTYADRFSEKQRICKVKISASFLPSGRMEIRGNKNDNFYKITIFVREKESLGYCKIEQ